MNLGIQFKAQIPSNCWKWRTNVFNIVEFFIQPLEFSGDAAIEPSLHCRFFRIVPHPISCFCRDARVVGLSSAIEKSSDLIQALLGCDPLVANELRVPAIQNFSIIYLKFHGLTKIIRQSRQGNVAPANGIINKSVYA